MLDIRELMNLKEAYAEVYAPKELTEEQVWEGVEEWVNALLEEGYDLSDYTWEEMYEEYLLEAGFFQGVGAGIDKAGSAVSGASKRAVGAAGNQLNKASSAVSGASKRAVNAAGSALGGASSAVSGASKRAVNAAGNQLNKASSAVQKVGSTIKKNVDNEIKISQQVGSGAPTGGLTKTTPSTPKPASSGSQYTSKNLGGAQYAAFKGGGGDAAIRKGSSAGEVVAQGRKNISKVVSGREMNATAPGVVKSGFDMFDVVKGYLIGEGYADTEEAALAIMANMSEDWKYSIMEQQMSSVSANAPSGVKKPAVTASISAGGKTPPGQKMLDKAGQMLSGKGPSNNFGRGF